MPEQPDKQKKTTRKTGLIFLGLVMVLSVIYGRSLFIRSSGVLEIPPTNSSVTPNPHLIMVHYHQRSPYYIRDEDGVHGLCMDPVIKAFETSGLAFQLVETPAKRQLKIIEQNKGRDCIVGWFKIPDREKIGKFTLPIYQDKPMIALAGKHAGLPGKYDSVETILKNRDLTLLRKDGYSYGGFLDEKIDDFKPRQEMTTAENLSMLKMIHSRRADYFFITKEEAKNLLELSGFPLSDFQLVVFSDIPKGNKRYLLCSRQVGDEVIEKLNAALGASAE